ncbi:MAG: energy-coupling factor transporter transmembrane component T [Nocardioidaceae bacterium]|jgi:energy-coupling factor transporter transmembrane protein EcfT|nr:energy-coupling factor transporter transmembrane protein EcfT [Nocardioidaceae bacterium]
MTRPEARQHQLRGAVLRANPLVLLAAGLLVVPGSFAVRSLPIGLVALGAYLLAGVVLLPSLRPALGRLGVVMLASVMVVYSTWLLGGHEVDTALTAGVRVLVLALPGAVLAVYVDPSRLADELGQRLGLPARFVVATSAALQRFDQLGQTWQHLDRARRARGFGPSRNPVRTFGYAASLTFALLVSALRGATQMSIAMDARGFADAHRRTWAEPVVWTVEDSALLCLGIALAALPVILYAL